LRKTADEGDVLLLACECFVALEQRFILRARHRIIRITARLRILAHDRSARVPLPGQMPEFGDAGELVIVRIIDRADRLMLDALRQMLMLNRRERYGSFP